jgi:hypothetical protein
MYRRSLVKTFLLTAIVVLAFLFFLRSRQTTPLHEDTSARRRSQEAGFHAENRGPRTYRPLQHAKAAERIEGCSDSGLSCMSDYFQEWRQPGDGTCTTSIRNGYPVPDLRCTPGGINPSITAQVLRGSGWKTRCIRNCQTSEAEKHLTYQWYGIQKPLSNSGRNQVCELDHLAPLELGGADGLGNIWPECGPDSTVLEDRYFKIKDRVENYLADEVKEGRISLGAAQQGIASDWTEFLPVANRYCADGGRC